MIDQISLDVTKIEMQKAIVKLLYEKEDITLNQYNMVISKLDKKIQNLIKKNKKMKEEAMTLVVDITV